MRALAAVIVVALLALLFPASQTVSERSAIAILISIGLRNAPTHFAAIRGDLVNANGHTSSYLADTVPDAEHYASCYAYVFQPDPALEVQDWTYQCNSTPRNATPLALFVATEAEVAAEVPAGYVSSGARVTAPNLAGGSLPWETWRRPGSPNLTLQVFPNGDGTSHYALAVG